MAIADYTRTSTPAVAEAVIPVDKPGTFHAKRVATTKIGAEMVVRNATIVVAVVPLAMEAVVPTFDSDGSALISFALLGLLCFLPASIFFLRSFLCIGKSRDSEKQEQKCCAYNPIFFIGVASNATQIASASQQILAGDSDATYKSYTPG
jgi:hypothetical protein